MAWPTSAIQWGFAQEPTIYDSQPVAANTLIYEGTPLTFAAGSSPAFCVNPAVANEKFAGWAVRSVDNTTAGAATPNILNFPNTGTGLAAGAFCSIISSGRIRLLKSQCPGGDISSFAGTQADINKVVYTNGSVLQSSSAANAVSVGVVAAVGTSNTGGVYWDVEFSAQPERTNAQATL